MRKKIFIILIVLVMLTVTMGAYQIHQITDRPERYFASAERVQAEVTPAPTPLFDIAPYLPAGETPLPAAPNQEAEPTADPDPLGEGKPLSGIVNIALFGIDAFRSGRTTSGTMPHTDANLIVAVNFDTKEVSLISIARDIFTDVPGHDGFYKFNCLFNVGGGLQDPHGGLALACRGAEEWLGGVSVPYYFGLDFKAAIDVIDAIGGIDYDSEIDLYSLRGNKLIACKGLQHLDGEGVFAYLRMRKTAGGLDYKRTERQRKMMIALFRKIKADGQLSLIPNILEAMGKGKGLYTNMSVPQIAALAAFAADIDPDQIRSYSIHGDMYQQYFWRYSMIDQQKRIDILKAVYGIDAAPMPVDTVVYEKFLYDMGFMALQHLGYAKRLFAHIHSSVSEGEMTEAQKQAYAQCWKDYEDLRAMYDQVDQWTRARYDKLRLPVEDQNQRLEQYRALGQLERELRTSGDALNKAFGSPLELKWTTGVNNWYLKDSVINEVYVDFA